MKNSYLYNHANDKCRWLKDFADEANHRPCTSLEMFAFINSILLMTAKVCWGHRSRNMMYFFFFFFDSTSAGPQQMCPVMSWLLCLCLWVSVTAIQLCQATFYDTIQQHPGTRPGRTTIHMIGERTADYSDKPKQMFSPSDIRVMWPRQQHRGFWSLMGLIRLSQALEKITSLFFSL